jgi:hypothetical protein
MRVFADNAGKVASVAANALPALISMSNYNPTAALVTGVSASMSCLTSIMKSLANSIYLYTFGDDIGRMTISGLAFSLNCNDNSSGANQMLNWYAVSRVSNSMAPIQVTFAGTTFSGFLMGMQIGVADADLRIFSWQATIMLLPDLNGMAAGSGSGTADSSSSGSGSGTPDSSSPSSNTYEPQVATGSVGGDYDYVDPTGGSDLTSSSGPIPLPIDAGDNSYFSQQIQESQNTPQGPVPLPIDVGEASTATTTSFKDYNGQPISAPAQIYVPFETTVPPATMPR